MIALFAFFGLLPACNSDSGPTWIDLTCGGGHACALAEDGTVTCWGKASDGQTNPPAHTKFTAISAGDTHTCGITDEGTVACWGSNELGESGNGGLHGGSFVAVSAGSGFTCAVDSGHLEQCWGTAAPEDAPNWNDEDTADDPVTLDTIDAGDSHVCAIDTQHEVVCWGAESAKSSKTDTESIDTDKEDKKPAVIDAIEIGAGRTHSCALTGAGDVLCWGMGQDSQADAQEDREFVHLAVGAQHNCAIDKEGGVSCWGDNGDDESDPPEGGGPYDRISAGDEFTCALERDGNIVCWGNNDLDQSHPPG